MDPKTWGRGATERPRRILVVEDYVDLAEAMVLMLASHGHVVATACDGGSALRMLETFTSDIVLLDLDLPDGDGLALADELRRHPNARDARFVAITGWQPREEQARTNDRRFVACLLKPVEMTTVLDLVAAGPRQQS